MPSGPARNGRLLEGRGCGAPPKPETAAAPVVVRSIRLGRLDDSDDSAHLSRSRLCRGAQPPADATRLSGYRLLLFRV